jgi:hypothetical protein
VAKLLLERGTKLGVKDILFGGTPAGWAAYAGKKEVEAYLRAREESDRGH